MRARCKKNESVLENRSSLVGERGATGSTGAAGAAGADGSIRIYGDGSAGPLNIKSGYVTLTDSNLQYTDCNVSAGASLFVASGTILRCTGDFSVAGFIVVNQSAIGGLYNSTPSSNIYTASLLPPHPGISRQIAGSGEIGSSIAILKGGHWGYLASSGDPESFMHYRRG